MGLLNITDAAAITASLEALREVWFASLEAAEAAEGTPQEAQAWAAVVAAEVRLRAFESLVL